MTTTLDAEAMHNNMPTTGPRAPVGEGGQGPSHGRLSTRGKIIDFRLRPPTGPYRAFFTPNVVSAINRILGHSVPRSYSTSLETAAGSEDRALRALIDEMDTAGVRLGIMNGRHSPNRATPVHIEDMEIAELSTRVAGRIIGLAGVNFDEPLATATQKLEIAIDQLGMVGVCLEPGLARTPMHVDDESIYPLYKRISELGIPALFMTGPFAGPDLSYTDPVRFERVARAFPQLTMILGHGCYPYVTQAVALAYHSEVTGASNVYLSPDVYTFAPGGHQYVDAINWLPNRFIYGSAYSFCGIEEAVRSTLNLDINDEALERYLWRNAENILALSTGNPCGSPIAPRQSNQV